MTELTWLINYLVYVLFGAILKKNTNKNLVLAAALSVAQRRIGMHVFFFQFMKREFYFFVGIFCCFRPRARSFYSQLKIDVEPGNNFHNARSLQENLARSAAYPKRAYYCT